MPQDDSRIEQLKKKLYSKTEDVGKMPDYDRLRPRPTLAKTSWETPPEDQAPTFEPNSYGTYNGRYNSFLKKVLWGAAIFFVLALAVAGYIFYVGSNIISANNLDLTLSGPVSVSSGDQLTLDIGLTNRNKADLQSVDIIVTYPNGTRSVLDGVSSMASDRILLGTLSSGNTVQASSSALLFGQENSQQTVNVKVEYVISGSNTLFTKSKDYSIFIGNSPLSVVVDSLNQITANQNATVTVRVISNSTTVVKSVVLKAAYPFGFQYLSANPSPISSNNIWNLGDIEPGGKRTIVISGKILGENTDSKLFNFTAGIADSHDATSLATPFVNASTQVAITKPFLGADISLDGDGSQIHVVEAGDEVKGEVVWQNNLDVPIDHVSIQAHLSGNILNQYSVVTQNGFYRSSDNTMLWDESTLSDLKEILPGESGTVQFTLSTLAPTTQVNTNFRQPSVALALDIKGSRVNESNVPETITSTVSRQIQVSSGLTMNTSIVRSVGPFVNTGPIPPKANQPSTYTVLVTAYNSFNTVNSAVFSTTLPTYVTWLGTISPADPGVTYNPTTREITWPLGDIPAGTGYGSTPRQFAFQVSLLPSISQVGSAPTLVNSQKIAGNDNYTKTVVQNIQSPLSTAFSSDPSFKDGNDRVVSGQ